MPNAHGWDSGALVAGYEVSSRERPLSHWARRLVRLIAVTAGMNGVRIDRGARSAIAVLLGAGSWGIATALVEGGHVLLYVVAAWLLYYVGNTLLLTGPVHRALLRRLERSKAYAVYELILGAMFVNQGLAVVATSYLDEGAIGLPALLAKALATVVFLLGFGCKLWATHLTSLDVYYYRDMFTRRPLGELVDRGPYRWLANPMYGLGNLHMYAAALWFRSWAALACAVSFQLSIYVFYFFVERPYVQRVYASADSGVAHSEAHELDIPSRPHASAPYWPGVQGVSPTSPDTARGAVVRAQ